ncbi:cobalt ECF transporter T component CbiQ [Microbacterium lacus]|uniref:cobalt ECF transporter T component CbiQ n=1 Tax=Microbacterium lacus TaxID=415217 RepID=UPI003850C588
MATPALWGHRPGDTWLHRASPRVKLLALVAFAVIVVATPREWFVAFGVYGVFVIGMLASVRIPPRTVLRRMVIEVPFVVFAVLMPFIATGPRTEVLGLSLSIAGLWGAWGLLVKATLAVLASIVLVTTTEPRRIVLALESLRLPRQLTSIMAFMLRYLDVIVGESARMRTARESRGFVARGPRSWRVIATGMGSLFARSHARGERVHLAMLARGYSEPGRL